MPDPVLGNTDAREAVPPAGMAPTIAISVDRLRVVRGDSEVLPGISLEIESGAVTGLLGPSGTGKSTLIRAIVGVQMVDSGSVTVLGRPAGSAPLRRRVGYLTQAPSVYADLSARENLTYFGRVLGVEAGRRDEVIETVQLSEHADRPVRALSGGQQARVSLATALLARPEILILDEPTVGLDPVLRVDLWGLFSALAADGATLLVSSHVMDEAVHCDRLLLMRDGRILTNTTPAELLSRTEADDLEGAFLKLVAGEVEK